MTKWLEPWFAISGIICTLFSVINNVKALIHSLGRWAVAAIFMGQQKPTRKTMG